MVWGHRTMGRRTVQWKPKLECGNRMVGFDEDDKIREAFRRVLGLFGLLKSCNMEAR